jgi:hypothetical protein
MTVKDSKVSYIFLASGDEGEKTEPAGRKVFELTLLAVLVARATSATVTYSEPPATRLRRGNTNSPPKSSCLPLISAASTSARSTLCRTWLASSR